MGTSIAASLCGNAPIPPASPINGRDAPRRFHRSAPLHLEDRRSRRAGGSITVLSQWFRER